MRYDVSTANGHPVKPQQAWIKRSFLIQQWALTRRVLYFYLLLVKMFPLRSEISPPGFQPCGHTFDAVHPLVLTMTLLARTVFYLRRREKRPDERKYQRFLFLSRLQSLYVCARRTSPSCGFIAGDASRLKEEEQVCLPRITWTDPPPRWRKSSSCLLPPTSSHSHAKFSNFIPSQLSVLNQHFHYYIVLCFSFFLHALLSVSFSCRQWRHLNEVKTHEDYFSFSTLVIIILIPGLHLPVQ